MEMRRSGMEFWPPADVLPDAANHLRSDASQRADVVCESVLGAFFARAGESIGRGEFFGFG